MGNYSEKLINERFNAIILRLPVHINDRACDCFYFQHQQIKKEKRGLV